MNTRVVREWTNLIKLSMKSYILSDLVDLVFEYYPLLETVILEFKSGYDSNNYKLVQHYIRLEKGIQVIQRDWNTKTKLTPIEHLYPYQGVLSALRDDFNMYMKYMKYHIKSRIDNFKDKLSIDLIEKTKFPFPLKAIITTSQFRHYMIGCEDRIDMFENVIDYKSLFNILESLPCVYNTKLAHRNIKFWYRINNISEEERTIWISYFT